jgi:hypothetical protein
LCYPGKYLTVKQLIRVKQKAGLVPGFSLYNFFVFNLSSQTHNTVPKLSGFLFLRMSGYFPIMELQCAAMPAHCHLKCVPIAVFWSFHRGNAVLNGWPGTIRNWKQNLLNNSYQKHIQI